MEYGLYFTSVLHFHSHVARETIALLMIIITPLFSMEFTPYTLFLDRQNVVPSKV